MQHYLVFLFVGLSFPASTQGYSTRTNYDFNGGTIHSPTQNTKYGVYQGATGVESFNGKVLRWDDQVQNGCCMGDQIIVKFRDKGRDGNSGQGMLYLNQSDGIVDAHRIGPIYSVSGQFGPYCAHSGVHSMDLKSDAHPEETSYAIYDSYGTLITQGFLHNTIFPITFQTSAPSKFCNLDTLKANETLRRIRAIKIVQASAASRKIEASYVPDANQTHRQKWLHSPYVTSAVNPHYTQLWPDANLAPDGPNSVRPVGADQDHQFFIQDNNGGAGPTEKYWSSGTSHTGSS